LAAHERETRPGEERAGPRGDTRVGRGLPRRRAHDAAAEIQYLGTKGYRWVLDADIEACFDSIEHTALIDRVRTRVKDKRVLRLIKAFLKAGL